MDPTSWAQLVFYVCGGVGVLVFSVSHLFRTMVSSYGSIITALQAQNTDQQRQLDTLKQQHEDCEKRHDKLEEEVAALKPKVAAVEKKVNGG